MSRTGKRQKNSRSSNKISEDHLAKRAMKVAKKLESHNVYGYANDSNPLGDSNHYEKFVWRKKIEQDVTQGVPLGIMFSIKAEKKRQKERMAEIEKVKRRREERAIEKAQREEEMALLARERAQAEFQDWEKKEKEFDFDQSKIRLPEGRIKPIDVLSKHLDPSGDEVPQVKVIPQGEQEEEKAGSFLPELLHGDKDEEAIDPEEYRAIYESRRIQVVEEKQGKLQEAMALASEDNLQMRAVKAMGAMNNGDELFGNSDEVNIDSQVSWWHDKYRPIKPKYFNRLHTGYEWNKYNQTHYDHDKPPPKIVQGYKFNIFYPDLVDKTKAPVYTIERDGDSTETCIIRFHGDPPYEDIAFRIVNKEWEYSHKKGFKCTFERGILHVYFNFKRYRCRR